MTCKHCQCADKLFSDKGAQRELRRYRKRGPRAVTRKLIGLLTPHARGSESLLDIGGGIGAIPVALLGAGLQSATDVDASSGYIAAARVLAGEKGLLERIRYYEGDFVDRAEAIGPHDFVTLDKVICCYPDYRALLTSALQRADKGIALVFPRDIWPVKLVMGFGNLILRIRGSAFRTFAHSSGDVKSLIESHGFELREQGRKGIWQIWVCTKAEGQA